VLRNSGYCGAGEGVDGTFDWDWVNDTARSSNTVTVDGVDHGRKSGAGVLEALVGGGLDYAASGSGGALPNGTHERSLLMVHGTAGIPGYFALVDEVQAGPGESMRVYLHPDSSTVVTRAAGTEYEWPVQNSGTASPVNLSVFLATPPVLAQLADGGFCAFDGEEYVASYLEAGHTAGSDGEARAVTLLVPFDSDHARPALARLSAAPATGARVGLAGGAADVIAESSGADVVVVGPEAFRGRAVYYRVTGGALARYFVRRGRVFDDGRTTRTGFDADTDVSVSVRGTQARITSAGANVTFFDPALTGRTYSTGAATVLGAGAGFVRVRVAPGTHAFDLASGAPLP